MTSCLRLGAALAIVLFTVGINTLTGAPPASVPVTVTIVESANSYPLRVQSDLQGAYVQTKQLVSRIETYSTGTDWMLTTYTGVKFTPSGRRSTSI